METAAAPGDRVFDRDTALRNLGGDADLLREIAHLFIADWPQYRTAILDALSRSDAQALRVSVHSVKGAVSNFGAARAVAAALDLEASSKAGDLSRAQAQVETMFAAVERVAAALAEEFAG